SPRVSWRTLPSSGGGPASRSRASPEITVASSGPSAGEWTSKSSPLRRTERSGRYPSPAMVSMSASHSSNPRSWPVVMPDLLSIARAQTSAAGLSCSDAGAERDTVPRSRQKVLPRLDPAVLPRALPTQMATPGLHPAAEPRPTGSHAERRVYDALRTALPAGWYAWHSLRLRTRDAYPGEGDFVIAPPARGLLILEVKGGAVCQTDGLWYQNGLRMDPPPLEQAFEFERLLLQRLRDAHCEPPAHGVAVAFPD